MADEPAKASYFYEAGGETHGPVDKARMIALAKAGTIRTATRVWTEAMPVKIAAQKLPFLRGKLRRSTSPGTALMVGAGTAAVGVAVVAAFLWMVPSAAARAGASACRGLLGFERPKPALCPDGQSCQLPLAAPDFTALDHNGKPVTLSSFRGKVVLLNFWASWCGTCKSEKESLAEMAHDLGSSDFEVVTLASDSSWGKVLVALVKSFEPGAKVPAPDENDDYPRDAALAAYNAALPDGVPFQVYLDPPQGDSTVGAIARQWGIEKVPESALIDRNGNIRAYFVNKREWTSLPAQTCIRAVLDED